MVQSLQPVASAPFIPHCIWGSRQPFAMLRGPKLQHANNGANEHSAQKPLISGQETATQRAQPAAAGPDEPQMLPASSVGNAKNKRQQHMPAPTKQCSQCCLWQQTAQIALNTPEVRMHNTLLYVQELLLLQADGRIDPDTCPNALKPSPGHNHSGLAAGGAPLWQAPPWPTVHYLHNRCRHNHCCHCCCWFTWLGSCAV